VTVRGEVMRCSKGSAKVIAAGFQVPATGVRAAPIATVASLRICR
jgi:hypothetical protein